VNVYRRCDSIEAWARAHNLVLNRKRSREIVFRESARSRQLHLRADIEHVTTLKILGVTITSTLSICDHICEVIKSCAQTQYALRNADAPRTWLEVFRSVVIAKITYSSTAWSGFANVMCNELTRFCGATRNVNFVNQTFRNFKNCVTLQTNSSATKFYTFSTTFFLHLRLLHSLTTSVEDQLVSYFLNILDTSRILTSLFA